MLQQFINVNLFHANYEPLSTFYIDFSLFPLKSMKFCFFFYFLFEYIIIRLTYLITINSGFRVVSHNILVPTGVKNPKKYPKCQPEYLEKNYRWKMIESKLEQEII